jgi:hypothetical protein
MEKLTENEKYHALLCVKYARHELSIKLFKLEIEYETHECYDDKLEQSIEQTDESIAFYDALINKLEKIL